MQNFLLKTSKLLKLQMLMLKWFHSVTVNGKNGFSKTWLCIKKRILYTFLKIHAFLYNQSFFATQPKCCLTFLRIELEMLLGCCLIHLAIIMLKHILHLVYLGPCLGLGLFMLHLCNLFFSFSLIFIIINHITSFRQTHLFFVYFFCISRIILG